MSHDSSRSFSGPAALALLVCTIVSVAIASMGGGYDLSWYTIDGGGGTSTGGGYTLSGTIGQPDASVTPMTGGNYTLVGGFWPGAAAGVPVPDFTLVSALSRRTHAAAGDFDQPLPIDQASAAVEPRTGGPMTLVLTFSDDVAAVDGTLDCGEVALSGGANCVSVSGLDEFMTINLTNAAPGACLVATLSGLKSTSDVAMTGDNDLHVRVLPGDATLDGVINIVDLNTVKGSLFQPVDGASFLRDVNADGVINIVDLNDVKGRLFTTLANCP